MCQEAVLAPATKILVYGAGAVGCAIGALLTKAPGVEVTFLTRPRHVEAFRRNGLTLTGVSGRPIKTISEPDVVGSLQELGEEPDYVCICVKSYDTQAVIDDLRQYGGRKWHALALQNGLENYERLAEAFGAEHVLRGLCMVNAELVEPGRVRMIGKPFVAFGEEDGHRSPRVEALDAIFTKSGVEHQVAEQIRKAAWSKFVWNCIYNTHTVVRGVTLCRLHRSKEARTLIQAHFSELQILAKAEGVELEAKDVLLGRGEVFALCLLELYSRAFTRHRGLPNLSTAQDLARGKPIESDAFLGAALRLGEKNEMNLPITRRLLADINAMVADR